MSVRGQVETENICSERTFKCVQAHSQQCQHEKNGDVAILWLLNVKAALN